jgi:hypothetical protein
VISGFNTDIEYKGVVYHIQTEDKGLKTPFVLSLVYQGGTILASKRSPYEDLIESGFDESELEVRVQRQHKLICAAVKAGRIEDLKRMTMKASKDEGLIARKQEAVISRPVPEVDEVQEDLPKLEFPVSEPELQMPDLDVGEESAEEPVSVLPPVAEPPAEEPAVADQPIEPPVADSPAPPAHDEEKVWDIPMIEHVEIVETDLDHGVTLVEEEIVLPPEAVKVIGEFSAFETLMDDELKVRILGAEEFRSGERKNVNVLVCRGKHETAVPGAGIMIKVLGSDFRPQIFHAVADDNGVATVSVSIPEFRSGRAAVLVRAMIGNEEAEIRGAILH